MNHLRSETKLTGQDKEEEEEEEEAPQNIRKTFLPSLKSLIYSELMSSHEYNNGNQGNGLKTRTTLTTTTTTHDTM